MQDISLILWLRKELGKGFIEPTRNRYESDTDGNDIGILLLCVKLRQGASGLPRRDKRLMQEVGLEHIAYYLTWTLLAGEHPVHFAIVHSLSRRLMIGNEQTQSDHFRSSHRPPPPPHLHGLPPKLQSRCTPGVQEQNEPGPYLGARAP